MHSGNPFTGRFVIEPKPQNVWGLTHAVWFFAMGLGGGLYLNRLLFGIDFGEALGMPAAVVLGMTLVIVSGLILVADLGRPIRAPRAFYNIRRSWISVGAVAHFTFLVLEAVLLLPYLTIAESQPFAGVFWAPGTTAALVLSWASAVPAFVIIVYPGLVLACSPSIPFWNTTLIPLQFLGSALAGGAAIAYLFGASRAPAIVVALGAVLATLGFTVAHIFNARYQRGAALTALAQVLRGALAPHFVWGNLILGLVLPSAALLLHLTGILVAASLPWTGALILLGSFLAKYAVIKAGHYAPLF